MTASRMKSARWLALLLLILGIGAMSLGGVEQPNAGTHSLPSDAESTRVANIQAEVQEASGAGESQAAIVFFSGDVRTHMDELQKLASDLGPVIPNEAGDGAIVPYNVESTSSSQNATEVEDLRARLTDGAPEGVTVQVTGPAAIRADLASVFEGANFLLLGVTAAIVALLLIATYRSPILWILPLLVIGIADRVAATVFTYVLDATGLSWNESTSGILSVLVFGAGTNYALLLISRYRDELTRHEDRFAAMAAAWLPTLKAVTASATTVILGVLCLLLSSVPNTRGLGLASATGIIIAWLFALFVLPGVLVTFGRWVFWPRRPEVGTEPNHKLWDRVGDLVGARPKLVTAVSLLLLAVCASGYFHISTGLTQSDQFLDTPESISAGTELEEKFPEQSATPTIIATRDADAVRQALPDARETGAANGWTLFQSSADFSQLRGQLPGETYVGGSDAQLADEESAAADDRRTIFPLVLALVCGALILMLRSLLAPLIMVASVLLTNVAALGLGWWVSHYIFGFDRFASTTPLFAFVFLVALGIDYTIFLITRAREDARSVGTRRGVLTALSATGGVITSAGILLAAVFAALGVLPLVVLAQLGITVFIGVLLDTLIVRTVLVPALVQLLGEKFWWPAHPAGTSDPETVSFKSAESPAAQRS